MAKLAIDFVSGPGALASVLRTGLLQVPCNGKSVPLDVGYSDSIPEAIRRAVLARDKVVVMRSMARVTAGRSGDPGAKLAWVPGACWKPSTYQPWPRACHCSGGEMCWMAGLIAASRSRGW
jgi:hypothetical protein